MSPRLLDGIPVVSLDHAIAAPFCTRQLADLGARVIKVERPGSGDFARAYDERVRGLASHFVWTNRSKESLTLDVKHPQAREVLAKLLEHADVLVQNLAPGAAARLRLRRLDAGEHGRVDELSAVLRFRRRDRAAACRSGARHDLPLRPVPHGRWEDRHAGPAERARVAGLLREGAAATRSCHRRAV